MNYGWNLEYIGELPVYMANVLLEHLTEYLEDSDKKKMEFHNAKVKGQVFKTLDPQEPEEVYSKDHLAKIKKHSKNIKERLKKRSGNI